MALLPRRISLAAILAIGLAGLQPMIAGTALGATGLAKPTGLAPNSATTPQKGPVLSWSSVTGALGYQVEMSKSNDFSDNSELVALPDGGASSVASYAVAQTLLHGVYYWRVRGTDGSQKGAWSSDAQLDRAWSDAPSTTASTPSSDATATQAGIASYPWRFAWTPLPDASSYEVELSVNPTYSSTGGKVPDGEITVACLTDATSWTPYGTYDEATPDINVDTCDLSDFDAGHTTVYWRVRGIDDSTTGQVAEASQKNTLECFGTPNDPPSSASLSTVTALGTPTSAGQECSAWSATGTVAWPTLGTGSVTAGSLGAVTGVGLDCPTGTSSDYACSSMPEISWQPVTGADSYTVTIADDSGFSNVEHVYATSFLSLTPRDQLADYTAGSGYYVAVEACTSDAAGAGCAAPTIKTFTKQTPRVTGLSATKMNGGVRLSWGDLAAKYATTTGAQSAEAEDYMVQVSKSSNPSFSNPVISKTVDASCDAKVNTCYVPPGASAAGADQLVVTPAATGSYIWRVLPVDLSGDVLPAATDKTVFSVNLTHPAFHISTKNGVAVTGPLTIKASQAVVGASGSTVHIVPQGSPVSAAVAGTLKAGSAANTWVFHPTSPLATGGTYVLSVDSTVHDTSGNSAVVTGSGVRTTTTATDSSKGWTYHGSWSTHTASGALSGSYRSAPSGSTAKLVVAGSEAELFGCKAPTMGDITVNVAGHTKKVSEHQSFTRCGMEIWHATLPTGTQTVTVTVSKGHGNVDELTVT